MNVSHNRNNSPIAEQQADHGEEEACTDKSMPGRAEEPDTRGDEKRREQHRLSICRASYINPSITVIFAVSIQPITRRVIANTKCFNRLIEPRNDECHGILCQGRTRINCE